MTETKLIAALTRAKSAIKPPKKGRTANVGKYSYTYADRADVIESYSKALSDNSLAIVHALGRDANGGMELITTLRHDSGEQIESRVPIPAVDSAQTLGSWLTYLERYQSCALLDIAAEDDDDGARAVAPRRQEEQPEDPTHLPFYDLRVALQDAAQELEQRGGGLWPEHVRTASEFKNDKGKQFSFSDPFAKNVTEKWAKSTLARLACRLAESEPGAAEGAEVLK
jgi:hypothetical protein